MENLQDLLPFKGNLVCECKQGGYFCGKPARDFHRSKAEQRNWPDPRMPIALCREHAGKHVPVSADELKLVYLKMVQHGA